MIEVERKVLVDFRGERERERLWPRGQRVVDSFFVTRSHPLKGTVEIEVVLVHRDGDDVVEIVSGSLLLVVRREVLYPPSAPLVRVRRYESNSRCRI